MVEKKVLDKSLRQSTLSKWRPERDYANMFLDSEDSSDNENSLKAGVRCWTRVIPDLKFELGEASIYSVSEDVKFDKACRDTPFDHQVKHYELLFDPESFKAEADRLRTDNFKLST